MAHTEVVPQWTLTDRLRKARESAGLNQPQLAEALGVSSNTVGNYERGFTTPRRMVLMAWAMVTGVPVEWLENDEDPRRDDEGPHGVRPKGLEPPTFWMGVPEAVGWELAA